MELNYADGFNRKFISIQYPEKINKHNADARESLKLCQKYDLLENIAEISKERIRRAGKKIQEELTTKHTKDTKQNAELNFSENDDAFRDVCVFRGSNTLDIGFRVLKVDTSNIEDVYYTPDEIDQSQLGLFADNIKADRTPEDLLFQVLLDWGVDLTLPIRKETIQGKTVFFVNHEPHDLIACFDKGITEDLIRELTQYQPLRVVFRDNGFASDAVKINAEQLFKQRSPGTDVKSI